MYTKDRILNMFKIQYKRANPDPIPEVPKTEEEKAIDRMVRYETKLVEEEIARKKANNIPLEPYETILYPPLKPDIKKMKEELKKDNGGVPFWDEPKPPKKPAKVEKVETKSSASEDNFEYSKLLNYLPKEGHPILKLMDRLKKLNDKVDKNLNQETLEIPEVSEQVSEQVPEKPAPKKEPKDILELDVNDPKFGIYVKNFVKDTIEFEKALEELEQAYQNLEKKDAELEYPGPLNGLPISLPPIPTPETCLQEPKECKEESLLDFMKRAEKEVKEMNQTLKELNSAYDEELNLLKKQISKHYGCDEIDMPENLRESLRVSDFECPK